MKVNPLAFFVVIIVAVLAAIVVDEQFDRQFQLEMAKAGKCRQMVPGAWNVNQTLWANCK
jgi:hypothetical protein